MNIKHILPIVLLLVSSVTLVSESVDGLSYAIEPDLGLIVSEDGGTTWESRSVGLPQKTVYPFTDKEPRSLTSVYVDPANPAQLVVITQADIFASEDAGKTWRSVEISDPVKPAAYLTAIARASGRKGVLYLGTSFSGLFVTYDGGEHWQSLNESIRFLYQGAGFYEEIRSIAVSPLSPTGEGSEIVLLAGFGKGVYRSRDDGKSWGAVEVPPDLDLGGIQSVKYLRQDDGWRLELSPVASGAGRSEDIAHRDRLTQASGKNGLYLNSASTSGEVLENHLDFVRETGLNTIVVDFKEDSGYIAYDSDLELPEKVGALRPRFEISSLVDATHERGVYLVARLVVFQDPQLYGFDKGRYAVWDGESDEPWGRKFRIKSDDNEEILFEQREFWVDPYSEFVWRYVIDIALEVQSAGVDEIQFDYIRFPSDGDLDRAVYRHRRNGMRMVDALESFLRMAREELEIPISVDIYGYNGMYRMGNWIGQSAELFAEYVDVICPMFYPSHYPRNYMADIEYFDRARLIYAEGTARAQDIVGGASIIRPYVQAFLIGGELAYDEAEFDTYLRSQLEGALSSRAEGFTLWNASNRYYMVIEPLTDYTVSALLD